MPTPKELSDEIKKQKAESAASQLKGIAKTRRKKERFLRTRMWFSTIIAALYNDRGSIPPNIGNNVFIGNNMYTTKNSLNAMLVIREFSVDTPVAVMSEMLAQVKNKVPNLIIDWTLKNRKHYINLGSSDLKSRVNSWNLTLNNPFATDPQKRRAARLLYSVDVIRSGEAIYRSVVYITVRASTGRELSMGLEHVQQYLQKIGCIYKIIKSDIQSHMDYALLMSDMSSKKTKDIPTNILSRQTLAEMLPSTQGMNDVTGTFLGIDLEMRGPYFINFRATAKAKNIYISALSGAGKTVLAQNWFMDMTADGYNMCIMDLKGTEFGAFTKAKGGIILSMKQSSTYYVNTFRMDESEVKGDYRVYFDTRFNLSKNIMMLLAAMPENLSARGESLLEEFLHSLYTQLGVTPENVNTWIRSDKITPYGVFDQFEKYLSNAVRQKYGDVADRLLSRLSIYMSRSGSNSHIFRDPLNYKDILETKVLTFDFGMLEAGTSTDPSIFKVKALYMSLLNDEYISYKASKGEWTGKVLEESGIAADYLIKLYAKDFMLRRSQNQVTILLGNSVSALASNPNATGILENINILVVGQLNKSSREYLVNEFGLDDFVGKLKDIQTNPAYENTFLLVNRMQKDATAAMLKAFIPKRVIQGKLFKIVDTEDS